MRKKKKPSIKFVRARLTDATRISADNNISELRKAFIDKFTLCDLACKLMLEGYKKYKGTFRPGTYVNLDMRIIPSAVEVYGLNIPKHILNGVFGGTGKYKKIGTKSAKKLRDGIVHAMNENDINEVLERYEELVNMMDYFLLSITNNT